MGKKQFCFFETAETGNRTPDSGVKGSGANHYPRAPALYDAGPSTIADSQNTSLTVSQCSADYSPNLPYASPNIRRNFGDTSPYIPRRFVNTSRVFSRRTVTTRSISAPKASRTLSFHIAGDFGHFGFRGTINSIASSIKCLCFNMSLYSLVGLDGYSALFGVWCILMI